MDPKLREFLQVMKAGREGVIADSTGLDVADHIQTGVAVVPGAESDDEYDENPSRREKSRRTGSPTRTPQVAQPPRDGPASRDVVMIDSSGGANEANDQAKGEDQPLPAEATDDDWLRSRTNRLLDLVDPEDLAAGPAPRTSGEPPTDVARDGDDPHSSGEMTHDVAADAPMADEVATDNTVDAIYKTSRLFVRNLPFGITEDDMRDAFGKYGALEEVSDVSCLVCAFVPCLRWRQRRYDESQIGTAYTPVYDETLGENFSRCFDFLSYRLPCICSKLSRS